jgi:GalNAc-alpha-(1->4)-GalNAc-alpha-(1->3)-diNAcBac-PP-undecaprenol alpha-1,4-N-acetyl-D-galactosaminyltransferase
MGGMERASINLANHIVNKGIKVYLITIFKKPHFFEVDEKVNIIEPKNFNDEKFSMIKTLKFIRANIKVINPDATLVMGQFYGALSMLSTLGLQQKIFISERSSPLLKWPLKQRIVNQIAYFIKKPDGVIAQTNLAKTHQQNYYGSKVNIVVIPNPLREVEIYPQYKRENTILAVGRLNDTLKGFDLLIESFAQIKDLGWRLVFAGGDENGEHLKNLAREKNVEDQIDFLGKVKNIDEVYAKAGIFVIPSRSEGFPNALCEAMAAGVPCISFDFVAGPSDIIIDGITGVLVENGNTTLLADQIRKLILNPQQRKELSERAIQVKEQYDADKICNDILQFVIKNDEK